MSKGKRGKGSEKSRVAARVESGIKQTALKYGEYQLNSAADVASLISVADGRDLPDSAYKYVQQYFDDLLKKNGGFEKSLGKTPDQYDKAASNLPHESYAVFNPDGKMVFSKLGLKYCIPHSRDEVVHIHRKDGYIIGATEIHNHPGGGGFSKADILTTQGKLNNTLVLTPNGIFQVKIPHKVRRQRAWIDQIAEAYDRNGKEHVTEDLWYARRTLRATLHPMIPKEQRDFAEGKLLDMAYLNKMIDVVHTQHALKRHKVEFKYFPKENASLGDVIKHINGYKDDLKGVKVASQMTEIDIKSQALKIASEYNDKYAKKFTVPGIKDKSYEEETRVVNAIVKLHKFKDVEFYPTNQGSWGYIYSGEKKYELDLIRGRLTTEGEAIIREKESKRIYAALPKKLDAANKTTESTPKKTRTPQKKVEPKKEVAPKKTVKKEAAPKKTAAKKTTKKEPVKKAEPKKKADKKEPAPKKKAAKKTTTKKAEPKKKAAKTKKEPTKKAEPKKKATKKTTTKKKAAPKKKTRPKKKTGDGVPEAYTKLMRKYARRPGSMSDEEKDKLSDYIKQYGYISI